MKILADAAGEPTNPDMYAERRHRLRKLVRGRGLDCLLVLQAPNRFYLSGFELHDSQPGESAGCLLICASGEDWLATDARYELAAKSLWNPERVFIYGGDMAGELKSLFRRCACLAGVESRGASYSFIQQLLPQAARDARIVMCDGLVEELRIIKTAPELDALRQSFRLNQAMLDWLEKSRLPEPGQVSEQELAWEIERFFREHGAQELAFNSIVAAGPNAALPHAIPGAGLVVQGAPLLIDVGCRVENYCSDQTRTFWLGANPSKDFARTLELVRDAQSAAIAAIKPGVPCSEIYAIARQIFENAGVAEHFNHGLGHGVGLQTHEAPSLSSRSKAVLKKGMVVTVEPGLYYPEWGGVRWEHTVAVTEDGAEVL